MATLAEIRADHPEYRDMSDAVLADAIHRQFYSDMPRDEFDKKIGMAAATKEGKGVFGYVDDAVRSLASGATFGYADEIAAKADEALGRGTYEENIKQQRARDAEIPAAIQIPGEIVGAVGGTLATAPVAAAAIPTRVVQAIKSVPILARYFGFGAGAGALSGSGNSEEGQRLEGAAAGAAIGGPVGVAAPYVVNAGVKATQAVVRGVRKALSPGEAAGVAGKAEGVTLEQLGKEAAAADAARIETPLSPLVEEATAKAIAAKEAAAVAPNRAGNINLDRVYAPDDVKEVIRQTAKENADFIAARRGPITQAETRDMAGLLGMSAEDLTKRKAGQAFNAEEMFAARELLVTQASKVRDLSRRAVGGSDIDKAEFAKEITRLVAVQEQVAGATAEAGRALSQFRMMAGASKEEIARIVQASKSSGIDDMARMVADLDDPAKVATFARNAFKAKTSDMLLEGWINALLSGPTTHSANILSNSLMAAWSIPESATAAAISKITGSGIGGREALERTFGIIEGAKDGIRAGWRAFRTEQPSDLATKIETRKHQAIPSFNVAGVEVGGKQVRIPGRLLMAEDEFFKAIGYRQEVNALSMRQALSENLSGRELAERVAELKANPSEATREAGRAAAEKQTFTNPLGAAGQGLTDIATAAPAFRVVMPFIKTPINVVKAAADRSPFAVLFKEARDNLAGANGPIARDNQIARIGLGSAVSATAAYLAADGTITGGGPSDGAKRALMRADGWQPYSVKIGGTYYSYSRFEPMGQLLGVAADFVEMNKELKEDEKANVAALLMGSVSRNLVSKTWMKGPADLIEAIEDPERYGPRYIQRLVGTVVPTGIAQYANANDPFLREARDVLDAVRSRIPGEREKLFLKRDAFGEPIKREGSVGPDLLSPVYQSAAKNDPTIAEMLRLRVTPGTLDRSIRNTELKPEEYDTFADTAGHTMKNTLDALVGSSQWRDLPEAAQVDAMHDVIRQSRDVARSVVFAKHPDLALRVAAETMKRKRIPQPAQ